MKRSTIHLGDLVTTIRQSGHIAIGRVMAIELGEARVCDGDTEFWSPVDCCKRTVTNICLQCNNDCKYKGG